MGFGPEALAAMAMRLAVRAESWPGMTQPRCRQWHLIAASDAFEAWVITWPPGGAIELHDHGGSAGAVVVAAGELRETSVVSRPSRDVVLETNTIGGRHIHDVVNSGDVPAISVHVYAPRLTSMTYYRMTQDLLEPGATLHYRLGQAVA